MILPVQITFRNMESSPAVWPLRIGRVARDATQRKYDLTYLHHNLSHGMPPLIIRLTAARL